MQFKGARRTAPLTIVLLLFTGALFAPNATASLAPPATAAASLPRAEDELKKADPNADAWRSWQLLPADIQAKIDPRLLAEFEGSILPTHLAGFEDGGAHTAGDALQPRSHTRFLIYLRDQPDLTATSARVFASHADQRNALFQSLVAQTREAQSAVRTVLDGRQATRAIAAYQSFYIANLLAVEGDLSTVLILAQRDDVERIAANYPLVPLWTPAARADFDLSNAPAAQNLSSNSWNIDLVDTDRVWEEFDLRGEGAVVAGFDTGVNFTHRALNSAYRGLLSSGGYDHNYQWFEPDSQLYADGNLGPSVSSQPYDCDGFGTHGTHTMGTMVGDGGTDQTQIGMAPRARWIAVPGICDNTLTGGRGDDIGALKAFQWLMCPTDLSGDLSSADCSMAPNVINNSWGSANPVNNFFQPIIHTLRTMGIAPVFASGNPDAGPGSIGAPGNSPDAITVGATDIVDDIAYFSGRGPSFFEGELKPELSAPGVDVNSSVGQFEAYQRYSGTSMAAPHVSGLIALLVSADLRDGIRDLDVDELERLMTLTAVDLGSPGHDNDFGYGRIDAYAAVNWVLSSGDLRGEVLDQVTGAPIAGATIHSQRLSSAALFTTQSGAGGLYSTTVPGGIFNITVSAWGYEDAGFARQQVNADTQSVVDFRLRPLAEATWSGVVRGPAGAVADARIYPLEQPTRRVASAADGAFQLVLPAGEHEIGIEADGHRPTTYTVTVVDADVVSDVTLQAAPSILLVDADARSGWFVGWPTEQIYDWALDQAGYAYDFWPIQYTTFADTSVLEDGTVAFGVPSRATLSGYDLLIWSHSGCLSISSGCIGAVSDELEQILGDYLNSGGRMIVSGQNFGSISEGTPFFDQYVRADVIYNTAATEGDLLVGTGFLEGLNVPLTNAALYGYSNGVFALSPDGVLPVDDSSEPHEQMPEAPETHAISFPILNYASELGSAALATASCSSDYRLVYYAMGFENIGPRASNRGANASQLLDRSITWLMEKQDLVAMAVQADTVEASSPVGATHEYTIRFTNLGKLPLTLDLALLDTVWPTTLFSELLSGEGTLSLSPCTQETVQVRVEIPLSADVGMVDEAVVQIDVREDPSRNSRLRFTTRAFTRWEIEPRMAVNRYNLGVVAIADTPFIYTLGGQESPGQSGELGSFAVTATSEIYDACTRRWRRDQPLPVRLANFGVTALGYNIYVIGGRQATLFSSEATERVWMQDTRAGGWNAVAPLPTPLQAPTVAQFEGKIYLFGGENPRQITNSNRVYIYDPAADVWTSRVTPADVAILNSTAATHRGLIYIAGGQIDSRKVYTYDPVNDLWGTAANLNFDRSKGTLISAPDGFLYYAGGATSAVGRSATERYDAASNQWQIVSSLNDGGRFGSGAAYSSGRIILIGGGAVESTESLQIHNSFCLSRIETDSSTVTAGEIVTFTVQIVPDHETLEAVIVQDPIPLNTTFEGFSSNQIGATYNQGADQIEWAGELEAGRPSLRYSYRVQVASTQQVPWGRSDTITNSVSFRSQQFTGFFGEPLEFSDSLIRLVVAPNFASTQKRVEPLIAASGDVLTYTIHVESTTLAGGELELTDPLPAALDVVSGTLVASSGSALYDGALHTVGWSGVAAAGAGEFFNIRPSYAWGDSDGLGEVPGSEPAWIDAAADGRFIVAGDDIYVCNIPIGFAFEFDGDLWTELCISTNGFISFDSNGSYDRINSCPISSESFNSNLIAPLWHDLVIEDGVYVKTIGAAPRRQMIVQWSDARPYAQFTQPRATFEVVLYEQGEIWMNFLDSGGFDGSRSTTGLLERARGQDVTYNCRRPNTLHSNLSIRFIAPGSATSVAMATVRFNAVAGEEIGFNHSLTNTVTVTSAGSTITRSAAVLLNTLDLSSSQLQSSRTRIAPGETLTMQATLHNRGTAATANSTLRSSIPEALTYVDGSLRCATGACRISDNQVLWNGSIGAQETITVTWNVALITALPDGTLLETEALLSDGAGQTVARSARVRAQRSDFRASHLLLRPAYIEPGQSSELLLFVQNQGSIGSVAEASVDLPESLAFDADSLACSSGACALDGRTIRWSGSVDSRSLVQIRLRISVAPQTSYGDRFVITAQVLDTTWVEESAYDAALTVAHNLYMPVAPVAKRPEIDTYLPVLIH